MGTIIMREKEISRLELINDLSVRGLSQSDAAKRRKWIKLHVAVDEKTQEIVHLGVISSRESDCKIGPKIISRLPKSVAIV